MLKPSSCRKPIRETREAEFTLGFSHFYSQRFWIWCVREEIFNVKDFWCFIFGFGILVLAQPVHTKRIGAGPRRGPPICKPIASDRQIFNVKEMQRDCVAFPHFRKTRETRTREPVSLAQCRSPFRPCQKPISPSLPTRLLRSLPALVALLCFVCLPYPRKRKSTFPAFARNVPCFAFNAFRVAPSV